MSGVGGGGAGGAVRDGVVEAGNGAQTLLSHADKAEVRLVLRETLRAWNRACDLALYSSGLIFVICTPKSGYMH